MAKKKSKKKIGAIPGEVVFTGKQRTDKVSVNYLEYNPTEVIGEKFSNQGVKTFHQPKTDRVQWYDIRGLHDTLLLEEIGKTFNLHPLIVEDIADVHQRTKFEEYENGIFFKINALYVGDNPEEEHHKESVCMFFGANFVLSFQEREYDLFSLVRDRITNDKGRIRKRSADYLAYTLIDMVIDQYFVVLDNIGERVENIEESIIANAEDGIKFDIHKIKREILAIRKTIYPLRESINQMIKSEADFIEDRTKLFYRDIYDHTIETMDIIESQRDMVYGLHDLYISEISFRMNKVMQVLTIVTTIFVPLTFLAGIYGMNFVNIPELQFRYGYYALLIIMLIIAVVLFFYFKRKKWM